MKGERQILLACARTVLSADQRLALRELCSQDVDWGAADRLAGRHGLRPLLHRHLSSLPPGVVPRAVIASLWMRHELRARRNTAMMNELVHLVSALAAKGVQVVPYKGPTLALVAYGDIAAREFGDLDLLVRREDTLRAAGALLELGYRREYALEPCFERELARSTRHYELPLRDAARGFLVELHWRADADVDALALGDPRWWQEREELRWEGKCLPTLRAEELMLALLLHGTKHWWASLGWLVDVAELALGTPTLDWSYVVEAGDRLGVQRKLGLGLLLAERLLQHPAPQEARVLMQHPVVLQIAEEIAAGLFAEPEPARTIGWSIRRNAALQPSSAGCLRYVGRAAFTPSLGDWQRWPSIPPSLSFLYWLLRPVRLAEKYLLRRTPPAATPRTPPPQPHSTG